jgi:hypothetical protein
MQFAGDSALGCLPCDNAMSAAAAAAAVQVLAGVRPELPPAAPTTTHAPAGRAAAAAASDRTGNEPASFAVEPQLRTLIQSCWQGTAQRRPAAQAVHKMLQQMMLRLHPPPPAAAAAAAPQPMPARF